MRVSEFVAFYALEPRYVVTCKNYRPSAVASLLECFLDFTLHGQVLGDGQRRSDSDKYKNMSHRTEDSEQNDVSIFKHMSRRMF